MGAQRALGRRADRTASGLDTTLVALVDRLTRRMRAAHRVCRTVILRLRFEDFSRATRSHTMHEPTHETDALLAEARELLTDALPLIAEQGVTLLGITFTNLEDAGAAQLALPFDGQRSAELDAAIDGVRDRYGSGAITRAVLLGRDPGIAVPLLPD